MNLSRKVIVVKRAMNPETAASRLTHNSHHLANALDTQLLSALVGRGQQDFDTNFTPYPGASAAEDECSIQCNVNCEAPFGVVRAIVPVKDDRKTQAISNGGSALQTSLYNGHQIHI
jgi:hypothetical protein